MKGQSSIVAVACGRLDPEAEVVSALAAQASDAVSRTGPRFTEVFAHINRCAATCAPDHPRMGNQGSMASELRSLHKAGPSPLALRRRRGPLDITQHELAALAADKTSFVSLLHRDLIPVVRFREA